MQATGSEQAKWLEHLLYVGETDFVIEFLDKDSTQLRHKELLYTYFEILKDKGEFERLHETIQVRLHFEKTPKILLELADYAQAIKKPHTAKKAYEKILKMKPQDYTANYYYAEGLYKQN